MSDDDTQRPSLEAPQLFGRRRSRRAQPAEDEPVFEDSATDVTTVDVVDVPADADTDATAELTDTRTDLSEPTAAPRRPRRVRRVRPALPGRDRNGSDRSGPPLTGLPAAIVVGVLAGLALVGFTWLGFRGCEAARGTTSCGTAPGMAALLVVFALTVVVGAFLLKLCRVPDPSATGFLATGLTCVVCLLFLIDVLDHWSMVIVVPAVSAATHALSWWLTTTYVETD